MDAATPCIKEWITNGYELNTTFKLGTNFKHAGKGGESFPWEFSLLEWIGRFGDIEELPSLVKKGLDPKFKCGGRSAFQVVVQSPGLYYDSRVKGEEIFNRIKALLDIGVEPNIIDPSGRTPLEYFYNVTHCKNREEFKKHFVPVELVKLLEDFFTADEVDGNLNLRQNLNYQHELIWHLRNENSALRQRVAQLECEKEELVKTTLTEVKAESLTPNFNSL